MKLKQNSFKTVSKHFLKCFVSVSFRCADSLTVIECAYYALQPGKSFWTKLMAHSLSYILRLSNYYTLVGKYVS